MKKILCIHPGVAYLPEIEAYKKYFMRYDIEFIDCVKDLNNKFDETKYDILWYMMGFYFKKNNKPKVHDYASLSTGKYPFIKDMIKKFFNVKPNLRLFLNDSIKNIYKFNDNVPYLIRDMGVDEIFFKDYNIVKKYDFVYVGSIAPERKTSVLLRKFAQELKNYTLLVIGKVPYEIYKNYRSVDNIIFTGKVDYKEVPQMALQAKYAINMVPDIYPFNIQTSTKLLEYCALNLKVITTSYKWVNEFEDRYNARFFKVNENLDNFDIKKIEFFDFKIPDVKELEWNKIFDRIKLFENIQGLLY